MLEIIPIQTKNSLKKNIIFPDSTFPESNCEYSSYHIGKENFMYSTLITRLIRFIILISMMIGVWLGKAYGRVKHFFLVFFELL